MIAFFSPIFLATSAPGLFLETAKSRKCKEKQMLRSRRDPYPQLHLNFDQLSVEQIWKCGVSCYFCSRSNFGETRSSRSAPLDGSDWWVSSEGLEFLAFVRLNSLTSEWSLGSRCEPIRYLIVGVLATMGGADTRAANELWADCGFFYCIFQLFFIHKKGRGERERRKKNVHSWKLALAWKA